MKKTRRAGARLTVTIVLVFAIVILFTGRLFQLQVVDAKELDAQAALHQTAKIVTPGIRGSIVDTNGVVLAHSVDRFDITASPAEIYGEESTGYDKTPNDASTRVSFTSALNKLAEITGTSASDLLAVINANPKSQYAVLDKSVPLATLTAVQKLKIPGIYYTTVPARSYPNGAIAGNLVGFVGTAGAQAGIEYEENTCLSSKAGVSTYQTSEDGIRIPGSTVKETNPVNGGTVQLTIDRDLDYQTLSAITYQAKKLGAPWATAVVERVSDGHLMAVADYPAVDPNDPGASKGGNQGSKAFTQEYEPGSTFKAMSASALIDGGAITPTTQVTVPPVLTLSNGGYIKDSFVHGVLHYTTAGVLENSSNIGISLLSEKMSAKERYNYMVKFGVGQKTAVNFPGQEPGVLTKPPWDVVTTKSVEFGQGVEATSVQVAQIFSTIANHGVREPSTLVEGCTLPNGTVIDKPTAKPVRVVSAKAADEVRGMLETVVTGGPIGSLLTIPGYRTADKTGTAQVAKPGGGGYGDDYIISVAGMAPAENPQYVVVVTFGPTTLGTSAGAAPAFTKVMSEVLKKYRVPPSTTPAPYVQTTW
jgi:cell division protein FtsI (penicillin-binding protein 3)